MKKRSWGSIKKQIALLATAGVMALGSVTTVAPAITAHAEEECGHNVVLETATKLEGSGEWTAEGGSLAIYACSLCGCPQYYDNDRSFFEIEGSTRDEKDNWLPGDVSIGGQKKTATAVEITAEIGSSINIIKVNEEFNLMLSAENGWSALAARVYEGEHVTAEVSASDIMRNDAAHEGFPDMSFDRKTGTLTIKSFSEPGIYTATLSVKLTPNWYKGAKNPVVEPFSFPVRIEIKEKKERAGRKLTLEKDQNVTVGTEVNVSFHVITHENSDKGSLYYFVSKNGGAWEPYGERIPVSEYVVNKEESYAEFAHQIKVPTNATGSFRYGVVFYSDCGPVVNRPIESRYFVYYTDEELIEYIKGTKGTADERTYQDVLNVLDSLEEYSHIYSAERFGKHVTINVGEAPVYSQRTTPAPQPQPQPEPVPEVLGVTRVQTPQTGLADKPMFYIVLMSVSAAVVVTGIVIKVKNRAHRRR